MLEPETFDDAFHARAAMRTAGREDHFRRISFVRDAHALSLLAMLFAPSALVSHGAIEQIAHWLIDHAHDCFTGNRQSDLHSEITVTLHEIFRAVHGIDQPYAIFGQTVFSIGGFFSQNSIVRKF